MAFTMDRWYDAVPMRCSVRKYAGGPEEADFSALSDMARFLSVHGIRIALYVSDETVFSSVPVGYGRVKGTNCFAAFTRAPHAPAYAEGYLGEALALECTAMGLGSCWLGMYHKKAAAKIVALEKGETLGCLMAIGVPAEAFQARPRRSLIQLTGLDDEALDGLPAWQRCALECARLAPSAMNAQPWRFLPNGDSVRILDAGNNHGYGPLDRGIAMLHIELGAAHCGVAGDWKFEGRDGVFRPIVEKP